MNRPVTILISVGAGFLLLAAGAAASAAIGGNFILGKAPARMSTTPPGPGQPRDQAGARETRA